MKNQKKFISRKKLFKKYEINQIKKIIINIGSKQTYKNLIEIKKFINQSENFFLIQIGSRKFKKDKNILYLKDLSQLELDSFLKSSNLFISSSLFEGFGRPAVEARLCNVPVLCIKNKINKEILGNSSYYYSTSKNLKKMVNIAIKNKKKNKYVFRYLINKKNNIKFLSVLRKIL